MVGIELKKEVVRGTHTVWLECTGDRCATHRHPGTRSGAFSQVLSVVTQHFDTVWTPDHFYGFDRIDDPFLECWTTLTWLAATFPQLKIGGLVMCNNYRHPTLLAHMGKTLQALSGGRLILGLGAGWRGDEYARHGLTFDPPAVRIRQLGEAIRLIRAMWTQPRTTVTGTYYQVQDLPCDPKPNPIPFHM
jgi:alkanesulfonate monooxygenase SsuD/methylene tetrahydromethanopterin reductase-like flavin-dependent oxidoreductase (luciferase family)